MTEKQPSGEEGFGERSKKPKEREDTPRLRPVSEKERVSEKDFLRERPYSERWVDLTEPHGSNPVMTLSGAGFPGRENTSSR